MFYQKTPEFLKVNYQVDLLKKRYNPVLPYNRHLALRRLESLEKKFQRNNYYHKSIPSYVIKIEIV